MNEKRSQRLGRTDKMPVCCVIPPYTLESVAENANGDSVRRSAEGTLRQTAMLVGNREAFSLMGNFELMAGGRNRTTYDALTFTRLPGLAKLKEEDGPCGYLPADEAHAGAAAVYNLFSKAFQRDSLDGRGQRLVSTVNYSKNYSNAFWNGRQMVYGDGDGELFFRFTACPSVIGHEFAHGLVQQTANLKYQGQSGALNESFADVFGIMVEQNIACVQATTNPSAWTVGRGLLTPEVEGTGIRNMLFPGTAYDDDVLGHDPQPDTMAKYVQTSQDNGGVHVNSSIPNRAFALTAVAIGGFAWEKAGPIWYRCLIKHLTPDSGFADAAAGTVRAAQDLYGTGSGEELAVRAAWDAVQVKFEVK